MTVEQLRNKVDGEIRAAIDSIIRSLKALGVEPPVDGVTCYNDFCLRAEAAAEAKYPQPPCGGEYAEILLGDVVSRVGYYDEAATVAAGWEWRKITPGLAYKNW